MNTKYNLKSSRLFEAAGITARGLVCGVLTLLPLLTGTARGQILSLTPMTSTFNVDSNADELDMYLGDGKCQTATGHCTLRAAIQEANALGYAGMQTINLPQNVYTLRLQGRDEDYAVTGDLDIRAKIEIVGAGFSRTYISGGGIDRVFHVHPGATLSVKGLSVQYGGLYLFADKGGGIFNEKEGTLLISECAIDHNTANVGGGVSSYGFLRVSKSRLVYNYSEMGGGLFAFGNAGVADSLIYGNFARSAGGGIFGGNGLNVSNTTIAFNWGESYPGLHLGGTVTITNCTISSNTATYTSFGQTAAIWWYGEFASDTLYVISSTISTNSGGIEFQRGSKGIVYLRATIVDQGPDGCSGSPGTIVSEGYNIDRGDSCKFRAMGDKWSTDPMLAGIAENGGPNATQALLPGSPAIDAIPISVNTIKPGFIPSTDQRGVARPQYHGLINGTSVQPYTQVYDIGAYELVAQPLLRTF